jgi:hypothetical protein
MPYPSTKFVNGVPRFILQGFTNPGVMIVSGGGPNIAGHALLRMDDNYAGYAHVHEPHDYPEFLTPAQFRQYLRSEGKLIWGEVSVRVPNLDGARAMLSGLARRKWRWLGVVDNCADFCSTVLNAGGANLPADLSNLPKTALHQALKGAVNNWTASYGPQTVAGNALVDEFFPV